MMSSFRASEASGGDMGQLLPRWRQQPRARAADQREADRGSRTRLVRVGPASDVSATV